MTFKKLAKQVVKWGDQKGILSNSTPLKQLDKTQEELDETREAIQEFMLDSSTAPCPDVKDGIGDMLVTIILLSEMLGLDPVECLSEAYDIISKRTGKMKNGFFVKDK
jgi:NTP pyrophosphatase (non-canonical NTP hydrolase)